MPELYLRLAEVGSPAQVAREYEINRSTVTYWRNKLSPDEWQFYEKQVAEAQNAALQEQKSIIEDNTKSFLEKLDIVKENLLEKLGLSISAIDIKERSAMSRLKDASIVVHNLTALMSDDGDKSGMGILQKFTELSKLHERKS